MIKIFRDEIYKPSKKNYETNKIKFDHIDELRSFDLMNMSDYGVSNNIGFRHILIVIDNFSEFHGVILYRINTDEQKQMNFQKILPIQIEKLIK